VFRPNTVSFAIHCHPRLTFTPVWSILPWSVLMVSVDAAGGDTRIRHLFWQELVMPTPTPWYNGGVAVSMLLTDKNGAFQTGHMYHYMYDFSKWKNSKLEALPERPKVK
jgi:hypothetical protein